MNELTGPWKEFEGDLFGLKANLLSRLKLATIQSAEVTKRGVVKHLQKQDLGWKKLNDKYREWKRKKGLSTATLISTSQMMQSITIQEAADKMSAFVGVLRSGKRKDGEKPALIAAIHEYGSSARHIEARPLFRPTLKEAKPEIAKRYREALKEVTENVGRNIG